MKRFQLVTVAVFFLSVFVFPLLLGAQTPEQPHFRAVEKDPFRRSEEERKTKPEFTPLGYPDFIQREADWRKKRKTARDAGQSGPAEAEKFLVSEIEKVSGLVQTPKGIAVLVKMSKAPGMLVVQEGTTFYNGSLVRIEKVKLQEADGKQVIGLVTCKEVEINTYDRKEIRSLDRVFEVKTR
ncbi:MAG: hypothetical protein K1Y36_09550 [Blastocatellia bacterium]|nr:hypothetical protein [Blastocatellia bacterium]